MRGKEVAGGNKHCKDHLKPYLCGCLSNHTFQMNLSVTWNHFYMPHQVGYACAILIDFYRIRLHYVETLFKVQRFGATPPGYLSSWTFLYLELQKNARIQN